MMMPTGPVVLVLGLGTGPGLGSESGSPSQSFAGVFAAADPPKPIP